MHEVSVALFGLQSTEEALLLSMNLLSCLALRLLASRRKAELFPSDPRLPLRVLYAYTVCVYSMWWPVQCEPSINMSTFDFIPRCFHHLLDTNK